MRRPERIQLTNAVFVCLLFSLCFWCFDRSVDKTPIVADGKQNLRLAYNIVHHGVFSSTQELKPGMLREPLWPLLIAGTIVGTDLKHAPWLDLATKHTIFFKRINVLAYALLTMISAIWLYFQMGGRLLALVCVVSMSLISILTMPRLINKLNNEALACLLLLLASICLHRALHRKYYFSIIFGILLGMLVLTKAQVLYISLIPICVLILNSWRKGILALTAMSFVVAPWLIRNYHYFDSVSISERGKTVLAVRLILTAEPTSFEKKCMLYSFSHPKIRVAIRDLVHLSDASFNREGECKRFNRELCFDMGLEKINCAPFLEDKLQVPWDSKVQYFFRGYTAGKAIEDNRMQLEDITEFDTQLVVKYLSTLPFFMWRGMGFTDYPALSIGMVIALFLLVFTKYWPLAVLPLTSHFFHVLITHNIPRYHVVEIGVLVIALSYVLLRLFDVLLDQLFGTVGG